jgi:hypothetical protein
VPRTRDPHRFIPSAPDTIAFDGTGAQGPADATPRHR